MYRRQFLKTALTAAAALSAERAFANTLFGTKSEAQSAGWISRFMDYTILSSSATLRAWHDAAFKERLLSKPNDTLMDYWGHLPTHTFRIFENSAVVRHLPLPDRSKLARSMTREVLQKSLVYETGDDTSLEYFLPVSVLMQALTDDTFKKRLIKAPNMVFREMGYQPGSRIFVVHENSAGVYNLALQQSPTSPQELASVEGHIINVQTTTKCCATGTCPTLCS